MTTTATVPSRTGAVGPPRELRPDIEGLRTIAVGLVVLYHLWPGRVRAGFIGVDVFLVVSGFLITNHLLAHPPRSPRDLAEFWGRRIRRLLPASFLVLAVTLVVTWLAAPITQWSEVARQVLASTFYVENWALASSAVDYLAADNAPSPVQHFWSLGVEEQFYLVWPVLVLVLAWWARRVGAARGARVRSWVTGGIGVVVAASFAWSLHLTTTAPARAYFETPVRVWELGAGALLAGLAPAIERRLTRAEGLRAPIAWAGILLIGLTGLMLDPAAPFPGTAAVLPVLGTVLVIAARATSPLSPAPLLSVRPVQYIGSISYSIYLWHWPLIILFPYIAGYSRDLLGSVGILATTLLLAGASKRFVEDPLRGRHPLGLPLWRTYVFMAVGMLVLVGLVGLVRWDLARTERAAEERLAAAVAERHRCFGAQALVTEGCTPHGDELFLSPAAAAKDKPAPYADGCWVLGDFTEQKVCSYGSTQPDARHIALVGNSHAGHWLPALQAIAEEENLQISTYLISECYTVLEPIEFRDDARSAACLAWNERVMEETTDGRYDAVVVSNRSESRPLVSVAAGGDVGDVSRAYRGVLDMWTDAGVPVTVIRDTPYADVKNVPDCVAENIDDLSRCDGSRSREVPDPLADEALARPHDLVEVVDLTGLICRDDVCYSTVGGVIVYFDAGHLSATFAESLAPVLRTPLMERLELS